MALHHLPESTVKLIGSSQVITSVSAAIKELVENALDSGAKSIDVRLDNHGMDKIEVKDDGCGINKDDVSVVCRKNYTSKISSFADLDELSSYGFRGEALNALCTVSQLSITTKTDLDPIASTYYFDNDGFVKDSKPSHITKGTIVTAEGLFRNVPVRRQLMTNGRRRSEEIKRVESIVKSFAIVHPRLRITIYHNKFLIWKKNSVANLKQSLAQAVPPTVVGQLDSFNFADEETNMEINGIIPRKDCNISVACFSNKHDAFYLYINSRPVRHKDLEKVVEEEMVQYLGHYIPVNKFPFCLLSIKLRPNELDVNLEPNKTKVLIKDLDNLIKKIKSQFLKFYTGLEESVDATFPVDIKLPKRKAELILSEDHSKIPKIENDLAETSKNTDMKLFTDYDEPKRCEGTVLNDNAFRNNYVEENLNKTTKEYGGFVEVLENKVSIENDCIDASPENESRIVPFGNESKNVYHEIDELEAILATSTQSSIMIDPDVINRSVDCFSSDSNRNSQSVSESDLIRSPGPESEILETSRCNNIEEFLSGLPTREENLNSVSTVSLKPAALEKQIEVNEVDCNVGGSEQINTNDVTLSQWSRGHVLHQNNAPVTIECNSVQYGDGMLGESSFFLERASITDLEHQGNSSVLERSASSQMGCKNMSAFTKFAKEMRAKILQQSPGISFTRVASELASKWKEMTEEERTHYEKMPLVDKGESQERKNMPGPKLKQQQITLKSNPSSDSPKGIKRVKYDNVFEVSESVLNLRTRLINRCSSNDNNGCRIVGKLSEDLYCFTYGSDLSVLSVLRLNEVINYYKNMSTMSVPFKVLENSIPLKSQDIGEANWRTLESLETSVDLKAKTVVIASDLINKNGFRVEVQEDTNGKHFELTDVPMHIPFCGLDDFKELLELANKQNTSSNLIECRPLKIAAFIRSETIRQCQGNRFEFENKGWESMLSFWLNNVQNTYPQCPHYKPVYKELLKIQ